MADLARIRRTLERTKMDLHKAKGVVATGIGYKYSAGKNTGVLAVICSVEEKLPSAKLSADEMVPRLLEGEVVTDVVAVGKIVAFSDRTVKVRPAVGGVSIGHVDVTAGTLGCLVKRDGTQYILSNNHVMANSNKASVGDDIVQPGIYDNGNVITDRIATLTDFVPIFFEGGSMPPGFPDDPSKCLFGRAAAATLNFFSRVLGRKTRMVAVVPRADGNLVDAAIARPVYAGIVTSDIMGIGKIAGMATGAIGMAVIKSGRTTGLTSGVILQTDVTVSVEYDAGKVAMFSDQLMAGAMSAGGDSGSAVLDAKNNLVGLLFAGSESTTIINRAENVFAALNLTL